MSFLYKNKNYDFFSYYYDICKGQFTDDLPLYLSICKRGDTIIEIGCGTGRILKAFLEKGYNITGVDISNKILNVAKRKLYNYTKINKLKLINHNFVISPITQTYTRILISFYTINYLLSTSELQSFLNNIYLSMRKNSAIIIDLFYPELYIKPEVENQWMFRSVYSDERNLILKYRKKMIGSIEERIQFFIEDTTKREIITYRRYIPKQDIYNKLEKIGFKNIKLWDGYTIHDIDSYNSGEKVYMNFVAVGEKR